MPFDSTVPSGSRFVSPLLIGRSPQLAMLRSAIERVRGGQGCTLLVTGDAGIGKSRLLATVRAEALENGFQVLEAGCFEPDANIPYATLLELLAAPAADIGTAAAQLAGFVADPAREPEQERHRLFVSLTQLFTTLSETQPLLLIVEDIHWCDETSLDFVRYLARHIAAWRVALILSYRADEPAPPLEHAIAELERARLGIEVRLNPLSRAHIELLAGAILSPRTSLPPDFVDAVFGLTDGNPFFAEEVLAVLAEANAPQKSVVLDQRTLDALRVPRSVHDAVVRRLARVSPTGQLVARLAAVVGREFDFALLQSLCQLDETELLRHLHELIDVHLVVEESAERLAFRHALTRQAIYSQLLARERQVFHGNVVKSMEQLFGGSTSTDRLADLAYHAYAARDWTRVRQYSARSGERAQRMYAPALAAEHFGRALEAALALGEPSLGQLHRDRARAYEVLGEFDSAEADYRAALQAAQSDGDRDAEWTGLLNLGFVWLARDYARAGIFFEHALALAEALGDAHKIAHSLNRVGNWHVNLDEPGRGLALHRRALTTFRELDDTVGIAQTLDLLGVAMLISGQRQQALDTLGQASAAYRRVDDRSGLASVLATRAHLRCASHVYDVLADAAPASKEALPEVEEALALAQAIGSRSAEAYATCELAACLSSDGQLGPALTAVRGAQTIAEELEHGAWLAIAHATFGMIALDLLDAPSAREAFERSCRAAQGAGLTHVASLSRAMLARAMILGNDLVAADALVREHVVPDTQLAGLTRASLLAVYAELRLVQGAANEAHAVGERLIAWAASFGAGVPARLEHLRGECLAALGRSEDAEGSLRAAIASAEATNNRPRLWQVHRSLGRLLQSQARRRAAGSEFAAARTVVTEMAASLPDGPARGDFVARVAKRVPGSTRPSATRLAREAYGGLTARERDVATLIGRGLSNAEIADRLVISERTVESHTAHIYAKLNCTSRSQITAWAIARGLGATSFNS